MSLANLRVREVTLLDPGTTTDRYGNTIDDWTTPTSSTELGWLARDSETETRGDRVGELATTWTLRLDAGSAITGRHRVIIDGRTFEVAAEPNRAWTPRGEHHVRVPLRIVDG